MGKIIFLDVDGTLVSYENQLPDSAVTAIQQARGNGHRVYICTGRRSRPWRIMLRLRWKRTVCIKRFVCWDL